MKAQIYSKNGALVYEGEYEGQMVRVVVEPGKPMRMFKLFDNGIAQHMLNRLAKKAIEAIKQQVN